MAIFNSYVKLPEGSKQFLYLGDVLTQKTAKMCVNIWELGSMRLSNNDDFSQKDVKRQKAS